MTQNNSTGAALDILERGNIFLFYTPKQGIEKLDTLEDVERLDLILGAGEKPRYRLLQIECKHLPKPSEASLQHVWGFVETVSDDSDRIEDHLDPER